METKPGVKTTEFWVGLIVPQILGILVTFGVITPDASDTVSGNLVQIVDALKEVIGLAICALSALGYNIGRGIAKQGVKPDGE